jgi:hypothetical protein
VKHYQVTREISNLHEIQMKRGTLEEAQELLERLKRRWNDIADMGTFNGGPPYATKLEDGTLTVYHGVKIVDCYITKETK